MKNLVRSFILIMVMLVTGFSAMPALAQSTNGNNPIINAEVDRDHISTDETVMLTITVNVLGSNLSKPQMPSLGGFSVIRSSSGTQIKLVNGTMSIQETYQYELRPTQTGELVIDPVTVNVNGITYSTDPIRITVIQGRGNIQPVPNPSLPVLPSLPSFPSSPFFDSGIIEPGTPMDESRCCIPFGFITPLDFMMIPNITRPGLLASGTRINPIRQFTLYSKLDAPIM
jgi:hypothetical protein